MRVGSLFSGIGGIDLGLMRAGLDIAWQVEIDPWCRKVLAKHWPEVKRYADIRDCGRHNLAPVDLIAGGFPCQDISNAGQCEGIDGARSGLWREMWRVIGELRPRYVFVENVAALLGRGMGRVLGDLAEIGYDAEWQIISAADMGAPHLRERVWILGYANHDGWDGSQDRQGSVERSDGDATRKNDLVQSAGPGCTRQADVADAGSERICQRGSDSEPREPLSHSGRVQRYDLSGKRELSAEVLADAERFRSAPRMARQNQQHERFARIFINDSFAERRTREQATLGWWAVEPNVGRVAHGIPRRVDRLRGLGNAVVPQIPELIGREILRLEVQP